MSVPSTVTHVRAPRLPTCCIADFQSAGHRKHPGRKNIRTVRRLEALRYSRLGNLRYLPDRRYANHASARDQTIPEPHDMRMNQA